MYREWAECVNVGWIQAPVKRAEVKLNGKSVRTVESCSGNAFKKRQLQSVENLQRVPMLQVV